MRFNINSEIVLESLINSFSEVVIFALDNEYRYLAFNDLHKNVMKQIWGVDISIGHSMLDYIKRDEDREKAKINFDRALNGESFVLNEVYGDEKLKRAYYEDHYAPIFDDNGKVIGLTVFLTEVTERILREKELKELNENLERLVKEKTEELKQSETKYKQLVELSPDIIGIHQDGKIIYVNSIAASQMGAASYIDLIGKSALEFIHPESRKLAAERISKLYNGEDFVPFVKEKFIRLDGSTFWGEIAAKRIMHNNKPAVIFYIRDLTKILEAERERESIHNIYRAAIRNISGVPYKFNLASNTYEFIGDRIEKLTGIKAKDFTPDKLKSRILETVHDNKFSGLTTEEIREKVYSGEIENYNADYKIRTTNGLVKWLNDSSVTIKNDNGEVIGFLGILQDITDRKTFEIKIRESEDKFRKVTEESSDGIVIVNSDGKILEWNKAEEIITGIKAEDAKGKFIWDVSYELAPPKLKSDKMKNLLYQTAISAIRGENKKFFNLNEYSLFSKDGKEKYVQTSSFRIISEGEPLLVIFMRDITEKEEIKRNLQRSIQAAEKAEALKSEFLAQISHEIRTPINVILSFADLIRSDVEDKIDPNLAYGFTAMRNAGNRLIRTVDLILNVAEIQRGIYDYRPANLDITDTIRKIIVEEGVYATQKGIQLNLVAPDDAQIVYADDYSVTQIFKNLIDNAVKYTHEGKVDVIIEEEDGHILVHVKDTGIGISEENLERIFNLFEQEYEGYTRKFEGNGLGLALTREYCKLNNADISVVSKKDEGSTFTVKFSKSNK